MKLILFEETDNLTNNNNLTNIKHEFYRFYNRSWEKDK